MFYLNPLQPLTGVALEFAASFQRGVAIIAGIQFLLLFFSFPDSQKERQGTVGGNLRWDAVLVEKVRSARAICLVHLLFWAQQQLAGPETHLHPPNWPKVVISF